ncbi:MAG TPA: hypothetical protein VFF67_06885 [Thermoplasmata archaeon]|nr:hypothetical protein [Thermoplasmata archaeon]
MADAKGRNVARRGRRWGPSTLGLVLALGAILLLTNPISGDVVVQYQLQAGAAAVAPLTPLTNTTVRVVAGVCTAGATGGVPAAGSARGNVTIVEARTCATRTLIVFLPPIRFTNGLAVPAGHVLDVRLDLVAFNGTTRMVSNLQLYVQRVGAGNPIVTRTHILIRAGAVVRGSTSAAALATPNTYGIGIRMILFHQPTAQQVGLSIVLFAYLDDGGAIRAVQEESVPISITY